MFRFKQFTIHQERSAMKVCTDACVLGAWADVGVGGYLLDIGTGTGLLALMAAQRNTSAEIDAVEIDDDASGQAVDNVADSPFASRVRVHHMSIQQFASNSAHAQQYDRILTNPPFYTNQLRSPDAAVNRALHTGDLPFDALGVAVKQLLKPNGQWWVLLPPYEMGLLSTLAQSAGLYPFRQLDLRHHALKSVFRQVTGFSLQAGTCEAHELCVYEVDSKTYTDAFRKLLRDYYLIF
jgi:tRNA1Val (adenine37-N6)-methyltransferase